VTAIGKVHELDASGLFDSNHRHAGLVVVTITCTHEQAEAWGLLWGHHVQALPFIPPAERGSEKR
jgi:hypothetical protein